MIASVLLLAAAVASTKAVAQSEPVAMVTAVYQRAAKGKGDSGGQFVWLDPKARPKSFSKSLVALWARADAATQEGDEGPVDFDPVTNSQDPSLESFVVTPEKLDATTAIVVVTFTERGERRSAVDRTVRYDLVREGGQWKIDDIRGSADGQPWSLRNILADSLPH